ncbi:hypothetical protein [Undibacterium umbellatum]|jgi:hypothetical protein|uniref:Uncharacterized protein n=1 Tax=Undibacterium umbellatum TaxID=2762300 RepID=A0ABR6ZAN8_9BURK|nr:hypothetical protein [Undibacterium umbellatum]MBC3908699.1 hypothetical protein [Undibacterium umbellatum]
MENNASKKTPIRADWWTKTISGLVLGFTLALAISGLFAWIGPGGIAAPQKVQFVMWLITPVWMLILSLIYLVRNGVRALKGLLIANALAYALLFLVKT